jgi:hypothetical protein
LRHTQNKVLVIMDYGIFRKQVYGRTGGQRDSSPKVTDSIQQTIGTWLARAEMGDGRCLILPETVDLTLPRSTSK